MRTNITIRIDAELAKEARILAARRGLSLSRMVADELGNLVAKDTSYENASTKAQKDIREAPELNYRKGSRESLHDRSS